MGWMKQVVDRRPPHVIDDGLVSWWDWHVEPMWAVLVLALQRRCIDCAAVKPRHVYDCPRAECWEKVGFLTEERYCGWHGRAAGWPCREAS